MQNANIIFKNIFSRKLKSVHLLRMPRKHIKRESTKQNKNKQKALWSSVAGAASPSCPSVTKGTSFQQCFRSGCQKSANFQKFSGTGVWFYACSAAASERARGILVACVPQWPPATLVCPSAPTLQWISVYCVPLRWAKPTENGVWLGVQYKAWNIGTERV